VTNEGVISTPAGQTIIAAGLQVGFAAHASNDPSLRGLDVWVGAVTPGTGSATNSGIIEAPTGSTTMAGRAVNQNGVIESSTSVNLNGRIDLLASYGAVGNPEFDRTGVAGIPFVNQETGTVTFGPESVHSNSAGLRKHRDRSGDEPSEQSQINVEGLTAHLRAGSIVLAPNAAVAVPCRHMALQRCGRKSDRP
jgi:hypothetical protein